MKTLSLCVKNNTTGRGRRIALEKFHEKIASLTFLAPACGCGNFLLIVPTAIRHGRVALLRDRRRDGCSP